MPTLRSLPFAPGDYYGRPIAHKSGSSTDFTSEKGANSDLETLIASSAGYYRTFPRRVPVPAL